jgi:hypothetical protein
MSRRKRKKVLEILVVSLRTEKRGFAGDMLCVLGKNPTAPPQIPEAPDSLVTHKMHILK